MKSFIGVRIEPEIAEAIIRDAQENGRTVSQTAAMILTKHYKTVWREDGQAAD